VRRTILVLAMAAMFFAEAVPLLLLPEAPQCCQLSGCPMHAKPVAAAPSFARCPGPRDPHALPPFLGRIAVVRANALVSARFGEREERVTFVERAIARSRAVEAPPPRFRSAAT
jgi:hypothetical protein